MFVDYDTQSPLAREHPWTVVLANPSDKYVDFKLFPNQIPMVLLGLKPWSQLPGDTAILFSAGVVEWDRLHF